MGENGDRVSEELREVRGVEGVLAPICVTLITLSNLALLLHELRVVWRSRRLIPPKLLVMALAATDLVATLFGFLPLWVLFETTHPLLNATDPSRPESLPNDSGVLSVSRLNFNVTLVSEETTVSTILSSRSFYQPVVYTMGYAVALFILTAFWTLAQGIVVVMGVERFLALRAPFFYTARCTCVAFFMVLGVLVLASCSVGGFHLTVQLAEAREQLPVFAGFLDSRSLAHNVFSLVQGLVWTWVLLMCNWGVMRELRRMEESVTVMRMKDHSEYVKQLSMVHGAGREFARFMMAVNVVFLLSSCPNLICIMLRLCGHAPSFSLHYYCWRMSHISALLNPFLYGFLRKSLRSRIRRSLNQHVRCLRPQRVGEMEAGPAAQYRNNQGVPNTTNGNANVVLRDPEASTAHLSD